MNRFRELHLLRRKILFAVLAKLSRKNEHAVERRAQLVRHVREKLRLVFRSQRQLLGLLFHLPARFFNFAVLGFDFRLLPRQQPRFFLYLFVCVSLKIWKVESSITAFTSPSKSTGKTTMLLGVASPSPDFICT